MAMEGGEVTAFPYWMMGAEEAFITSMVCDLARLNAQFANSPELENDMFTKVDGTPDWLLAENPSFIPGLAPLIGEHFGPCTDEEAKFIGCAPGTPQHDALAQLLVNKREKLKFEYEHDGQTFWCGQQEGPPPLEFPAKWTQGDRGKKAIIAILKKMGSRKVQTMIHGTCTRQIEFSCY
jgi:hypothetical protein